MILKSSVFFLFMNRLEAKFFKILVIFLATKSNELIRESLNFFFKPELIFKILKKDLIFLFLNFN